MKDASNKIIQTLQERGYRITPSRRLIIEALFTESVPKTVKDIAIHTHIKDLSTVYRTLSELVKEHLVEEFADKGVSYFELSEDHHDHAVCTSCGKIEHVPCEDVTPPRMLARAGWNITNHEALWRGLCASCK